MGRDVVAAACRPVRSTHPQVDWSQVDGAQPGRWTVEKLTKDDWPVLRQVRLRSLDTSPDELGGDRKVTAQYGEREWRELFQQGTWFVANEAGAPIAVAALNASAFIFPHECTKLRMPHPHLEALWVDPLHRRRGIAQALVKATVTEAATRGAPAIGLWVFEKNIHAADWFEKNCKFSPRDHKPQRYRGEPRRQWWRRHRREYHMHRLITRADEPRQSIDPRAVLNSATESQTVR
ncbi:GNAT family N-acetyltransferase [Pseudofrankia sp. BMG5.37]|uniref:GNAT family N-acetyltransferase n=1 Tax=Pseudofrankia sp. BMG5.37 TaxID=3050035 RepID=UPI0028960D97|nr:GNAT family N-acetyltransferase [Pseudofrankia sp. BMG5.37]MDT3438860.1 GNAT family N-acetyltransferase [Pseudofrankia sp. BMG5.37]